MSLISSILEMPGAPPPDFAPGRMNTGLIDDVGYEISQMLERLSYIEEKTGVSFSIPTHDISVEDLKTIAATARILETGHGQYEAQPWISVSSIEQAKSALESFETGNPMPMALHFDGQVVVIFDTHVMLGPVTFFYDRAYITKEDLEDLRKQLEAATADSEIRIRFTPSEDCSAEARYLNWLPSDEAAALEQLPIYDDRKSSTAEDTWSLPAPDVSHAVALLESWYDEDTEEQTKAWELLKASLEQDRPSDRKLFP